MLRFALLERSFTTLDQGAVIDGSANHVPTAINVGQIATVHGACRRSCEQERRQRNELVIHALCVVDTRCLECHLQTAAAHTKAHRVHVDVVGICRSESRFLILRKFMTVPRHARIHKRSGGMYIAKERHVYTHFGAAAFADVGCKRGEADMLVDQLVRQEK